MISSEVDPEWTAMVGELIRREGRTVRANPTIPVIDVKSFATNNWMPLMLPNSGVSFASFDDRNAVMKAFLL